MSDQLYVTMLGGFTLRKGDEVLDENSNRMRKVWLLLAYIIYSRNKRITQEQYLTVLQGTDAAEVEDPMGRLKALFYRVRTMLDGLYPGAGRDLVLCKRGVYSWNAEAALTLDVEEFEALCTAAATATGEEQLTLYRKALALYKGDFLAKLSMEQWVVPISTYYHQMYLDAVGRTLSALEERKVWEEAAELCAKALQVEPYSEAIYQHLMQCRLALGDKTGVMSAYEEMSELLFDTFGVMPSDESRKLYRDACRQTNEKTVPIDTVRDQLREAEGASGAVLCGYDFFQFYYRVQARSIIRSGEVIHIALLSVHGPDRQPLQRKSLDRVMDNLEAILLEGLRRGDIISRCSVSQLVVLLSGANYEDSCMVCQRLIHSFFKKYPHSPARLKYSVQPLEPTP